VDAIAGTPLQHGIWDLLRESSADCAGVVVEDDTRTLVDVNGGCLFEANSIRKLYTGAAVLLRLGPDTRFRTEMRTDGARDENGTLYGDLVLVASGDPTFSSNDLAELCAAVAAAGIRRVAGSLIIDDSRYDRLRTVPHWKPYYVPTFCAPLSAFVLDGNRLSRDDGFLADPVARGAAMVNAALLDAGVRVDGASLTASGVRALRRVAEHLSAPMAEIVRWILLRSDNFAAELLLKELGADHGVPTTAGGLDAVGAVGATLGVDRARSTAVDGSGLSEHNTDTPRRQVAWLRVIGTSAVAEQFRSSLPVAAVAGTLARRLHGTPAAGRVFAKTGTRRRSGTVNLAGYAQDHTGRHLRFSFVLTGAGSHACALGALDRAVALMMSGP